MITFSSFRFLGRLKIALASALIFVYALRMNKTKFNITVLVSPLKSYLYSTYIVRHFEFSLKLIEFSLKL